MNHTCPSFRFLSASKRLCVAAILGLLTTTVAAQSSVNAGTGSSAPAEKFGCRSLAPGSMATEKGASCMPTGRSLPEFGGDPFVFCTEGVPEHCWIALNPLTGQWKQICYYLNPMWIATYEQICPRAMSMGHWQGAAPPSMTPSPH